MKGIDIQAVSKAVLPNRAFQRFDGQIKLYKFLHSLSWIFPPLSSHQPVCRLSLMSHHHFLPCRSANLFPSISLSFIFFLFIFYFFSSCSFSQFVMSHHHLSMPSSSGGGMVVRSKIRRMGWRASFSIVLLIIVSASVSS